MVVVVLLDAFTTQLVSVLQARLTAADAAFAGKVGDGVTAGAPPFAAVYVIDGRDDLAGLAAGASEPAAVSVQVTVAGETRQQRDRVADLVRVALLDPSVSLNGTGFAVGDRRAVGAAPDGPDVGRHAVALEFSMRVAKA